MTASISRFGGREIDLCVVSINWYICICICLYVHILLHIYVYLCMCIPSVIPMYSSSLLLCTLYLFAATFAHLLPATCCLLYLPATMPTYTNTLPLPTCLLLQAPTRGLAFSPFFVSFAANRFAPRAIAASSAVRFPSSRWRPAYRGRELQ